MAQPRLTSRLRKPLSMAVLALYCLPLLAQQPADEEVVVTAHAYPSTFADVARTVTVLTREDLANLPISSIGAALRYATTMDLRQRGPSGAQADFSIRGSNFGQVLVLVDGIRLNDAQTAHHNSDFPISLNDIERIEILAGPGSSLYGADAFGGAVNIITRKNESGTHASLIAGEYGLARANVRTSFDAGSIRQTISFFGEASSGFAPDRDFTAAGVSFTTTIGDNSRLRVAHVSKEFGAAGFYGPTPSREWTSQSLVTFERRFLETSRRSADFQVFYRTHGDRFLWDVEAPELFESHHRTHAVGFTGRSDTILSPRALLSLATDLGSDWIRSANLGDHSYMRVGVSAELQLKLRKSVTLYPGVRVDRYTTFGNAACPS